MHPMGWIFMQDNVSPHTSNYTKQWLGDKQVDIFPWPAKVPEVNPTENGCALEARQGYKNREPYPTVDALNNELNKTFKEIRRSCLKTI